MIIQIIQCGRCLPVTHRPTSASSRRRISPVLLFTIFMVVGLLFGRVDNSPAFCRSVVSQYYGIARARFSVLFLSFLVIFTVLVIILPFYAKCHPSPSPLSNCFDFATATTQFVVIRHHFM